MQKIQVLNGLSISYNEGLEQEKLDKVVNFIKKYTFIFNEYENNNHDETIDINEFNSFIEDFVKQIVQDENTKKIVESKDFLPTFYLTYLILKNGMAGNTIIQIPNNVTIELVLFFLSIKYYNYDISKISATLLSDNSYEYDQIRKEIKSTQRINTYNYCLSCVATFLEEYDETMLDNLSDIINKIISNATSYFNAAISDSKLNGLKQLTNEEFDKLFIDFLDYINAPKKWCEFYNYLKANNLIEFEYDNENENGECYFDEKENKWKIKLISNGTIMTFVTFVHEFIHYVSLSQNPDINFSLLEFPSIYYENIAAKFLKDSGYEEGIVDEILNWRNANNYELYAAQIIQFIEVLEYKKNGTFSIEKRIELNRNLIEGLNQYKINMVNLLKNEGLNDIPQSLFNLETRDPVEIAYQDVDEKINEFIKSGVLILNGYQYLVGSLLSSYILEKNNKENANDDMVFVTEHLQDYSITSIMQLFSINLSEGSRS